MGPAFFTTTQVVLADSPSQSIQRKKPAQFCWRSAWKDLLPQQLVQSMCYMKLHWHTKCKANEKLHGFTDNNSKSPSSLSCLNKMTLNLYRGLWRAFIWGEHLNTSVVHMHDQRNRVVFLRLNAKGLKCPYFQNGSFLDSIRVHLEVIFQASIPPSLLPKDLVKGIKLGAKLCEILV